MNQYDRESAVWGPWFTAGIGMLIFIGFFIAQTGGAAGYIAFRLLNDPNVDFQTLAGNAAEDGLLLSISIIVGSLVGTVLVVWAVWNRTLTFGRKYLALAPVTAGTWMVSFGLFLALAAAADLASYLLNRPIVPEVMTGSYGSMPFKPLFWIAVCLAGPIFEELFFRGFLMSGWINSRLRPVGAVFLSTIAWTFIHLQYGPYELSQVFLLGLMLGLIRVKTGSILPAIGGHILLNIIATAETAFLSIG